MQSSKYSQRLDKEINVEAAREASPLVRRNTNGRKLAETPSLFHFVSASLYVFSTRAHAYVGTNRAGKRPYVSRDFL